MNTVRVWKETVKIPTYDIGTPEKYPMFLEKRVYQGSSGAVYPYPVVEKISDEKKDKEWLAIYLENEFLKIMVLPELGGRIQMAYDKTKERHFIYYNHVIKPALVGLTGPWISGGIEFNWPQHHRPSTYDPVDFFIEENEDGSATVWCSELERMFHTKGMTGFTLYPQKSYLEIKVKLYNKTAVPQTFLWWANPAVQANDHYQSVFPPDVNAVFDHGKRDVSSFPIAKGVYYKVNYAPGTDISKYKNIPVPTSYMAITSKYDFVGGYENDTRGGVLHVANHHLSPGKKQWTWGNGEFGHAWDRNLTDGDGPYVELMCGVYTDNQPDFSWLAPNEEKEFTQYFMPYRDLGMVKNATKNAMVNLEIHGQEASVKLYTTGVYPECTVRLYGAGREIYRDTYHASPDMSYEKVVKLPEKFDYTDLYVCLKDKAGKELVSWQAEQPNNKDIPEPAKAAKPPMEIENNEQLYLTGLHLEQYRHATFNPTDYYKEALRRDEKDVRCANALGLWYLKRGLFGEAEPLFRKAIETLTERNPNPYDGEPFYHLGLALRYQGKNEEAYGAFYKATWNAAWQNPAYFHIAQLDCLKGEYDDALYHVNQALSRNTNDHKARHLKIAVLRLNGAKEKALALIDESLLLDRFNFGARYEKFLLTGNREDLELLHALIRRNIHNYIEYALDYAWAGLYEHAIELLTEGVKEGENKTPMAWYYLAWFHRLNGSRIKAVKAAIDASEQNPDYCFPNQVESVIALQLATYLNPQDARAYYYLGNFWYNARRHHEAIACWERSVELDDQFPIAFRNLALGYFNKKHEPAKAVKCLEKAFELDGDNPRILMELDQLYKRMNRDPKMRLAMLERYAPLVEERDDLYLERASLYNLFEEHAKAYELIMNRKFHPWEGGEGKVSGQYQYSLIEMAKIDYHRGLYSKAIEFLQKSLKFTENLGEGKLFVAQENDIYYWLGNAYDKLGEVQKAVECWQKASVGSTEPAAAMFYNDQQPDKILYQGLALMQLSNTKEAYHRFNKLIDYGKTHMNDRISIDYFAISLPDLLIWEDDLNRRNVIHCTYMIGLGLLGLEKKGEAKRKFEEVLELEKTHQGALTHLKMSEKQTVISDRP